MNKLACAAFVFSMLLGVGANAATLSVSGGTAGTLPGGFDPLGWSNPDGIGQWSNISIFTNANAAGGGLYVTPATSIELTFTYMGTEAGNTNFSDSQLSWDNTPLFNNMLTPVGTSVSSVANLGTGLVPLLFRTLAEHTGGTVATAANGGPIAAVHSIAFSEILFGNTVYAFFGDGLGDSDRDDMVVRISATVVPLPAAGLLFPPTALALLGYFGWRGTDAPQSPESWIPLHRDLIGLTSIG